MTAANDLCSVCHSNPVEPRSDRCANNLCQGSEPTEPRMNPGLSTWRHWSDAGLSGQDV